jgi:hypothetical protein
MCSFALVMHVLEQRIQRKLLRFEGLLVHLLYLS